MLSIAIKTKTALFTIQSDDSSVDEILTEIDCYLNSGISLGIGGSVYCYDSGASYLLTKVKSGWTLARAAEGDVITGSDIDEIIKKLEQNYEALEGKIIRFEYNGGTRYGEPRIVKVTKVAVDRIHGKDLVKDEDRNYLITKIRRFPEVIQ